ncbi:hypothetical protein [Lapillicoccus jejuensis]|uniref:Condensation domain-containing protein n=1 Tax=Lapillicoccus jejuensis TaxID=402171 RepID=A0A542E2L4_9MICO|nr:hypothetical protein [Lapillicoccus jejuensis]TQJ09577.1 hypothetical protein FB458_2689 [Lapillicoccus jejuensis]
MSPPPGRRVAAVDRAWAGRYAALLVSGVRVPPVDVVRATVRAVVTGRPDTPYGALLDPRRLRWVPVDPDRVEEHLDRVVVAGPDPRPGQEEAALEDLTRGHEEDLPVRVTVGPTSLGCTASHMVGDAVTTALLLRSLLLGDPGPVLRERRLDAGLLGRAALAQTRTHARDWARLAVQRRPVGAGPRGRGAGPPDRVDAGPGSGTRLVGTRLEPADLAAVSRWRNAHAPGAPLAAALATLSARALVDAGVPLDTSGLFTLVDLRRYLVGLPPGTAVGGNLAKAVRLPCDLLDPRAVGSALAHVVASGRPVPATVLGAVGALLRPPSAGGGPGAPLRLTFNTVPGLPGSDTLPWLEGRRGRYVGAGFPVAPDGLSLVAHRLRDHLELTASVAPGTVPAELVRDALRSLVGGTRPGGPPL